MTPRPAGPGARVGSYLVDLGLVVALAALTWPFAGSLVIAGLVALEAAIVLTIARAATGRTPGALATRTAGHRAGSDLAPGLFPQATRSLLMGALHLTGVGPLVTTATAREGRDWVDRIAGTAIADTRSVPEPVATSLDPYGRATAAGAGQVRRTAPSRSAQPAPVPAATRESAPQPRRAVPQPTVAPPEPDGDRAVAEVCAVFDSGLSVPIGAVTVLGREPGTSGDPAETAVAIPDPTRSLSRTHLRLGVDAGGVWIEDAFSANGTSYRVPEGRLSELTRGHRVHVPIGTVVVMGDRSMTIAGA